MRTVRFSLAWVAVCLLVVFGALPQRASVDAANFTPAGFTEALVASGLASPTAMQFAPDGRLFVCEQAGRLRVIQNGVLLSTPFLTIPASAISSSGERGLLGVAFDPNFATNHFVYVYYTATAPALHNRISRFTANGNVAVAGSETVILDLDNLSSATNHNGGALAFGPDGKLYAAVGENANGSNAQTLSNLHGKMLRINANGTIPTDNPFFNTASNNNRAIWALGLRNPFTFAFGPGGRLFINDVGQNTWEEINDGIAGSNYGWPTTEGPTTNPNFRAPISSYHHNTGGCAITGGAFYAPLTARFPSAYIGDYFFADYCGGWIDRLDVSTGTVQDFATGITFPVDLKVSDDGALYYLARGSGASGGVVYRIDYGATAPTITQHPSDRTVAPGASVTFSVRASGPAPLGYQWQRNTTDIPGATGADYTIASVVQSDNGVQFRARVSNSFGTALSNAATLTVTGNQAPTGTISQPTAGTLYSGGNVINYSGTGTDPEDGNLPPSAFTWQVDFHHDTHVHPFIPATSGASSGSFTIPTTGHTEANVYYRIRLTIRDSGNMTHESMRDVMPRTAQVTLGTNPAGLQVLLDGQPITTPHSFTGVAGIVRTLAPVTPQGAGGTTYEFVSWSDGGAATHNISTPAASTTYTATYRATSTGGTGTGLSATYFNNIDLSGTTVARIDPTVDFNWGSGSPHASIAADTFSARWTGQVEAQFTGTYTFNTVSDDGVRLWVNGQQIINNWTDHAPTENSGTIALTAGQRYDIRMEFFENGGGATARLLWSSASIPKAVVPATRLYPPATSNVIRINFQPAGSPVPAGYLVDGGLVFANRGNGQSYGWNADNSTQTRDRNATNSPDQRYDTLTHLQKPENPDGVWEIAVPSGTYVVRVVSGDAAHFDSVFRTSVEGILTVNGTPTTSTRWVEGTSTVTVMDGRLTVRSAGGSTNNKVCFVEITRQ